MAQAKIIPFHATGATPSESAASACDIWRSRIRRFWGSLFMTIRIPGAIANTTITDPVTHHTVTVSVGALFTRITLNGRDYYFDRFSGKFAGTGSGCQ